MNIKLSYYDHHAVSLNMGKVIDELSESKHRHNQLLCQVLAEIFLKMSQQQLEVKTEYKLKLSAAQTVAMQWFCESHMAHSKLIDHEMVAGKIMNTIHKLLV